MGVFEDLRHGQIDHGYFGNHTATIDWCELNYTHSNFIAEWYNCLTNVPTILLGLWGCYGSWRGGLRRRYYLGYLGLTGIGLGSFGFHASLMWEWQLMDELPMIYLVSYCGYLVLDHLPEFQPRFGMIGPAILIAWDIFVTVSYFCLPNPIYHQLAFGAILLFGVTQNFRFIRQLSEAADANPERHAKVIRTLLSGIATFVVGFILWNVDNFFCSALRRGQVFLGPLGFVLQGHGYWHLMTGYGSFLIMTASASIKTSPDAYDFDPSAWFPVCYRVQTDRSAPSTLISKTIITEHVRHADAKWDERHTAKADTKGSKSREAEASHRTDSEGSDASSGTRRRSSKVLAEISGARG